MARGGMSLAVVMAWRSRHQISCNVYVIILNILICWVCSEMLFWCWIICAHYRKRL